MVLKRSRAVVVLLVMLSLLAAGNVDRHYHVHRGGAARHTGDRHVCAWNNPVLSDSQIRIVRASLGANNDITWTRISTT